MTLMPLEFGGATRLLSDVMFKNLDFLGTISTFMAKDEEPRPSYRPTHLSWTRGIAFAQACSHWIGRGEKAPHVDMPHIERLTF